MNKIGYIFIITILACVTPAEDVPETWTPKDPTLLSVWAENLHSANVWDVYPRPQFEREEWLSLNGLWNYKISKNISKPDSINEGEILVPFPPESSLSGVHKTVQPDDHLWYSRTFEIPSFWNYDEVKLHFDAVDWEMVCWINEQKVGQHKGGYDPFSFNIGQFLQRGQNNIIVKVRDPSNTGNQALGKQTLNPGGIYYTAVSGIWQSVWLEPLNDTHIKSFQLFPDIDRKGFYFLPKISNVQNGTQLKLEIFDGKKTVVSRSVSTRDTTFIEMSRIKLWHPDHPFLYDIECKLVNGLKKVDLVKSYFGLRKIEVKKAQDGHHRIFLNNEVYFQNGPLDQGYWPGGLYTPPSDAAIQSEVQTIKDLGFNMLRKHVKVEPDRFYYWCDKIGILVWQDMPNGDQKIGPNDPDILRSKSSADQFQFELSQLILTHFNHPSIIMWIPFNEGWGQYQTAEITNLVRKLDPTRLVNSTSGWADRGLGDILDQHSYPAPTMFEPDADRAIVLGEFGGLSLSVPGHLWDEEGNWGYAEIDNEEIFNERYESFYEDIWEFEQQGLSACVYTQITDVETETNGLLTYDRKKIKLDKSFAVKINQNQFVHAPQFLPKEQILQKGDRIMVISKSGSPVHFTLTGSEPDATSKQWDEDLIIHQGLIIKAIAIAEGDQSRVVTKSYEMRTSPKPVYKYKYSDKYMAGGSYALVDGEYGNLNFRNGKWQGFEEKDLDVIIDMGEEISMDSLGIHFYENTENWIFLPSKIDILVAGKDQQFKLVKQFENEAAQGHRPASIQAFSLKLDHPNKIQYFQIKAKNIGICPNWHPGDGQASWIFADEIFFK